jgi:uncharacterized protein YggE
MNNIHTSTHVPTDANSVVVKNTQRSYTTTISFIVYITKFAALGTFASSVGLIAYTSINGLRWGLHDSTRKAYDGRLRSLAVEDALERAKDYAKALGLSTVWPVEVREVQWCDEDGDAKMKGVRRFGAADPIFEPEEVMLSARVECKFEAE